MEGQNQMIRGLEHHPGSLSIRRTQETLEGFKYTPERGLLSPGCCNHMLFGSLEGMRLGLVLSPSYISSLGPGTRVRVRVQEEHRRES